MNFQEAIEFVEAALDSKTAKQLTSSEKEILKAAWDKETYSNLADSLYLSVGYVKDLAAFLWLRLSSAFGQKITKNNFRRVMEVLCGTPQDSEETIEETNTDEIQDPKPKILIVDDLVENLQLLTEILEKFGYIVRCVTSGKMALKTIHKIHPDLILLDILMPEMDGYQVCQSLKADQTTSEIPIIFLSAFNQVSDKLKAFKVGGIDYITKPFHREEVVARVKSQLTIQQQKKELKKQIEYHRKLAEIFYQSRSLLANLLNSSKDGILAIQAVRDMLTEEINDFHCLVVNPVFLKLLGQKREDLMGEIVPKNLLNQLTPNLFDSLINVVETGEEIEGKFCLENVLTHDCYYLTAIKFEDGCLITVRQITNFKLIEFQCNLQANNKLILA
ncbi:MAG TPA: response regulator [Planktothrix sp. UBA10369]|jgi:Response regulator containing a CheY-like receiver domain and a GGDEF domain|nr:response regulator [Planktothrix sp. UBA10369]